MHSSINTNLSAISTQRNLSRASGSLTTALQRLSTGLRINSARDDAAGLAIAERFTSQIRGSNQAARNANDALSLTQTAEASLASVTSNLQRIREIAVQAANGTNSSSDRAALQLEVSQRIDEANRTLNTASFNGKKLLDGSFSNQNFQIGADAGQTLEVSIPPSTASLNEAIVGTPGGVGGAPLQAGVQVINGVPIGASVSGSEPGQTAYSAWAKANALKDAAIPDMKVAAFANIAASNSPSVFAPIAGGDIILNGIPVGPVTAGTDPATQAANIVEAINKVSGLSGVTATVNQPFIVPFTGAVVTDLPDIVRLHGKDGRSIEFSMQNTANSDNTGFTSTFFQRAGHIVLKYSSATENTGIRIDHTGRSGFLSRARTTPAEKHNYPINADVSTVAGAQSAITLIDAALIKISSTRATLGAQQNRFEAVASNLQSTSENLTAARSRIVDADFAIETAALTRAQIIQNAGTAMLAQANARPNQLLSLLPR